MPVGTVDTAGLTLVHCATAKHTEGYGQGKDGVEDVGESRWNGKVIVTLSDRYMEVEEPFAELRPVWLGEETSKLLGMHVAALDSRRTGVA